MVMAAVAALNQQELTLLSQHGVERFNRQQRQYWQAYDLGRYTPESIAPIAGMLASIKTARAVLLGTLN